MSEHDETLADIVAEMRGMAAEIRANLSNVPARREDQRLEANSLDREADRIEAAWKRECATTDKSSAVGNAAAMREALVKMSDLFERGVICTSYANTAEEMEQIEELYHMAKSALSNPPRACDVMSQEDLTNVVISGFMKSLGIGQENQLVSQLAEAAISAAIKCAYDTQLVVKKEEGGAK